MYAIVRISIHLHGLSTVHPLRSVCAFRFSVHLPPATRYSLPLSTIHPSFPPSDVQTFPNPSPRLENCLFSNLFSRPNSPISRLFRDITRIETRQFGTRAGSNVAQRASENAESFGLQSSDNQTKRNGTPGLFNFHVRPPGNRVGRDCDGCAFNNVFRIKRRTTVSFLLSRGFRQSPL